jgi:thioredoxin-related protein
MLRAFLTFLFLATSALSAQAAEVGDDGLHKQDWFAITFRDIAEDIETAADEGKRLAMIFEQRGCIYCREIHEIVLADPDVREYIEANFMVVQYNLYGDEEVIDTDGQALTEKTAARKWGILFTPTVLFMPESLPAAGSAKQIAVAAMPGAFRKGTFLDMFTW